MKLSRKTLPAISWPEITVVKETFDGPALTAASGLQINHYKCVKHKEDEWNGKAKV